MTITKTRMTIIHNPSTPLHLSQDLAVAIGMFDGVHLGHRALIERVKDVAKARHCPAALITYDNHPSLALRPNEPTPLIYTSNQRLSLLEQFGVDYILLFTFNHSFANQTAEQFLAHIKNICPFSYLNMGYDGRLGKNRSGDEEHLKTLSKRFNFILEYMPAYSLDNEKVSSTAIRDLIRAGDLNNASALLGRPYSIAGHVITGKKLGRTIGFPTANLLVHNIVTPPPGVWAVDVIWEGHKRQAVANLGVAPTVNTLRELLLEVHIPHYDGDLYGKVLEVVFKRYLRPEMRFDGLPHLQAQLKKDVHSAITEL
ncbi:MAG: bifunctional riboflavin kinase/FAD synthetase [Parachlamydiales bacterium]